MNALNMKTGERLNMSKTSTISLNTVVAGARLVVADSGDAVANDLSAFVLYCDRMKGVSDLCYFHQKTIHHGAVVLSYGNRDGSDGGGNETITVKLNELPKDADAVVFVMSIYEVAHKNPSFNKVKNASIHMVNPDNGQELINSNVSNSTDSYNALVFAKIVRSGDDWLFVAENEFYKANLDILVDMFSK